MRNNPLQFAVVREDPAVELALLSDPAIDRALLIASGGCTALSLLSWRPELELTLVDFNPAQLELVQRKIGALADPSVGDTLWTVGCDAPNSLNGGGNFESLFRSLRRFIEEFIVPRDELLTAFEGRAALALATRRLVEHPYWPVAFELHFADSFLRAMFGDAAIQRAPATGYPAHFRAAFERGLGAPDALRNRFLHHLLLGHYLRRELPPYLAQPPLTKIAPELVLGRISDVADLASFGLISLSNICDWMDASEVRALAHTLNERAASGATLLLRVLGESPPLRAALGGDWEFDDALAERLHAQDQSLFYSQLLIARKR